MAVKAKHSAGGEYSPDWRPKVITPYTLIINPPNADTLFSKYLPEELMSPPEAPPPAPMPVDEPMLDAPARPGWRTVVKRPEPGARRKGKAAAAAAAAAAPTPPPPPPPAIEAPRPELPSWAQWRRKHSSI
jgi:hypothetical protein